MFSSFPAELRKHGLHADARTLLQIYQLMSRGLVRDLGSLYSAAERLVVKDPRERGPYTVAFFAHFLDIPIQPGQSLDEAVILSDTFYNWRIEHAPGRMPTPELVNEFLERIFRRTFSAEGLEAALEQAALLLTPPDVPFLDDGESPEYARADHNDTDLAELLEKMRQIAEQQEEPHRGGHKYIGTNGVSPYGHAGASLGGIRVGGKGSFSSARLVLSDPRYFPVDMNAVLSDNNVDAALAALKGVAERQSRLQVDIPETIEWGARRGGLFLPQLKREEDDRFHVMLFIDNGGYSMDAHIPLVRVLFRKMKTRFAHDLRIFYFHNIIRETVFADETRVREPVRLDSLCREGQHYSVFVLGDASMAPYELHGSGWGKSGYRCLQELAAAFPKLAWLNPVPERSWYTTETIGDIRLLVPMFPLTPRGIERAVRHLNRTTARSIEER